MTFPLQSMPLSPPAQGHPAPLMAMPTLYEDPAFRRVAGPTLRPGGLALTTRGLDACALRQDALVLDIGCGTGASAALTRSRGLRAVGVDASEALLREARDGHPGLPFMKGAAEGLPLRGNVCDALLCECVLSLSSEPDQALAEFRRVLKPDGSLILTDIYLRQSPSACATNSFAPPTGTGMKSCIEGAVSHAALVARLKRQGFNILLFEDHSRLLADLTARLVFAGLSPSRFFNGPQRAATAESALRAAPPEAQACACGSAAASPARLGYYLLVASGRNR